MEVERTGLGLDGEDGGTGNLEGGRGRRSTRRADVSGLSSRYRRYSLHRFRSQTHPRCTRKHLGRARSMKSNEEGGRRVEEPAQPPTRRQRRSADF